MTVVLLLASFGLIIGGAVLFTNAVEWLGRKLDLGSGAVGSILAAVGTALPESLIPIVALISGAAGSREVAIGAIIGAPFLLATLAMALVAIAAFGFRGRREQGSELTADVDTTRRDLLFFLPVFGTGLALGIVTTGWLQTAGAIALVAAYAVFVWRTISRGGGAEEEELRPLYADLTKQDPPNSIELSIQLAVGLGMIIGGAELFVEQVTRIAESLGVGPLVLALVLAPLATELPEKSNSFLWVRRGKDSLALGNITGAMVFQASIPVSIGLLFTPWDLSSFAIVAAALGLAGGTLALFELGRGRQRVGVPSLATWLALFSAFLIYAVVG